MPLKPKERRELEKMLEQKFRFIQSQFEFIPKEEQFALQTAITLAAIRRLEIDQISELIQNLMPEHIAHKIIKTVQKFIQPLQFSYVNPESEEDSETSEIITKFYLKAFSSHDMTNAILLQLADKLLDHENDPLNVFQTEFLESKDKALPLTFLSAKDDTLDDSADEMDFYCKKAVFQQESVEMMTVSDFWNPSQKFKNLVISPKDINRATTGKVLKQSKGYQWLYADKPTDKFSSRTRWAYIAHYVQMLEEYGKMAVLVPSEFLDEDIFCEERKFFISHGCIESIIILPRRLNSYAVMILRSPQCSDQNQKIYFYDASSVVINVREPLSADELDKITKAIRNEDNAYPVSNINQENYTLKFTDNGRIKLDAIASINRGAMILNSRLEAEGKFSEEETDFLLLRSQDIEDGLIHIQEPATFLRNIDNNLAPYCLMNQNKTLIICKNKSREGRFRTALFESSDDFGGKKFLVNSNVYLLKIDEEKANPYYVQAYLESPEGQERINKEMTDTLISATLYIAGLKEITIPACDMETQNRIADQFRKNLNAIREHKRQITELQNLNNQLFSED